MWCLVRESNPRLPGYRPGALPSELTVATSSSSDSMYGTHRSESRTTVRRAAGQTTSLPCLEETPMGVEPNSDCFAGSCLTLRLQRQLHAKRTRLPERFAKNPRAWRAGGLSRGRSRRLPVDVPAIFAVSAGARNPLCSCRAPSRTAPRPMKGDTRRASTACAAIPARSAHPFRECECVGELAAVGDRSVAATRAHHRREPP